MSKIVSSYTTLAATFIIKQALRMCVDFCMQKIDNIRLDTHADNLIMQHASEKLGFKRCGIIYCIDDGSPRIAYQRYGQTGI